MITRDTDYAVRAVSFIACQTDGVISASDLVRKLGIPRPFLRKILQVLNRAKILRSYRGRGGGFELTRPADKILLVDLVKAFQGPFRITECYFRKKTCPKRAVCALRRRLDKIEKGVVDELSSISIKDIIRRKS